MTELINDHPADHGFNHPAFWPGACTSCRGDLQLCEDDLGPFRKCVNCSRTAPEGLGPVSLSIPISNPLFAGAAAD